MIRLGSTLPKDILLECTWCLVSLVEAESDTKLVDRGLIMFRHRMLSSHGCCVRRYTIHHQYTISRGIRYDLAQLYLNITYLNVPGTLYLSWKRSPTRNGLTVRGLIISRHRMLSWHGCCVRTAGTPSCGYHTHTIWGRRRLGRGARRGDPVRLPQ